MNLNPHLLFVPHRASAEHGHLGHSLLLQSLHRVALGPKQLAHKVELKRQEERV